MSQAQKNSPSQTMDAPAPEKEAASSPEAKAALPSAKVPARQRHPGLLAQSRRKSLVSSASWGAIASGNRRTAFMTMKYFLIINNAKIVNNAKIGAPDDPANARVLQGIREGYYSDAEIKEWIQHGKVREFTR